MVAAKPSQPSGPLSICAYTADSVSLAWQPADIESAVATYRVESRELSQPKWHVMSTVEASASSCTVRQLQSGSDYLFRVIAENDTGLSLPLTIDRSFMPRSPIGTSPARYAMNVCYDFD